MIPQLEAQMAALKEQAEHYVNLPGKVDKATEELDVVREALF